MSDWITGPAKINCPNGCHLLPGFRAQRSPERGRSCAGVVHCPHEDVCGAVFVVEALARVDA